MFLFFISLCFSLFQLIRERQRIGSNDQDHDPAVLDQRGVYSRVNIAVTGVTKRSMLDDLVFVSRAVRYVDIGKARRAAWERNARAPAHVGFEFAKDDKTVSPERVGLPGQSDLRRISLNDRADLHCIHISVIRSRQDRAPHRTRKECHAKPDALPALSNFEQEIHRRVRPFHAAFRI